MTKKAGEPVQVLHLTDTHLFGDEGGTLLGVDTRSSFESVVAHALGEPAPDLVLATGDLSQDGQPSSYRRLQSTVAQFGAPTYWLPGNHDVAAVMSECLNGGGARMDRHARAGDWDIVLLDSVVPGEVHGLLEDDELQHLATTLESATGQHALVALHHHPVPTGSAWLDGIGLRNADAFFDVVDRFPTVRGVIWGHVHQDFAQERHGVRLLGTPSTCFQFKPHSQKFAVDRRPPGYRWLTLHPDGRIDTRVEFLARFDGNVDSDTQGY